jgi:nucleoid DNA-binding protein
LCGTTGQPEGVPVEAGRQRQRSQLNPAFAPLPAPICCPNTPGSNFYGLFLRLPIGVTQFMPYISLADGVGTTNNQPFTEQEIMAKTAKKAAPKKAVKKVATKAATKAAAKPAAPKPIKEALTKSGLVAHIAEATSVAAKDVRAVFAALEGAVAASVNKKGAGSFTLPGLLKISTVSVPAKPKRKGINPFTKEEQWFAAKPATTKLKVRPLKKLKDAAL